MYAGGTIDHEGPLRLPPTAATQTRIKQKRVARGTAGDPLIISDGSSPGVQIWPAKNFKAEGVAKVTKLSEYVIITSSDEENVAIEVEDDAVSTAKDNGHHDYKDPGLGADCKCKANLLPVLCPSKKHTSTLEPAPVNAAARKGKQRAVERKASNQVEARVFKGVEVINSSDSEGENPDFLTVRPMQRPCAGSASSNCKVSSLRDCSFVNCLFII